MTVDEYIELQPAAAQNALIQVRNAIRQALPQADETISSNIPTYKIGDQAVLYFAGWKRHFSLYPASQRLLIEFDNELAAYKVEKSTIRFPLNAPIPVQLVQRIAKFRVSEMAAKLKSRAISS